MVSRRAYRRVSVNEIDREQLLELAKEHGKGTLWPFATLSEHEQILRHQVFRIDAFRKQQTQ